MASQRHGNTFPLVAVCSGKTLQEPKMEMPMWRSDPVSMIVMIYIGDRPLEGEAIPEK
jgi:hypothetical protein